MKNYSTDKIVKQLVNLTEENKLDWEKITHDVLHEDKYRVAFFRELYEGYVMDFKMSYFTGFENGFIYLFLITNKMQEDFFLLAVQSNSKALLTPLNQEEESQPELINLHENILKKTENIDGFLQAILNYSKEKQQ